MYLVYIRAYGGKHYLKMNFKTGMTLIIHWLWLSIKAQIHARTRMATGMMHTK